jgi:hypothetical protein
VASDHFVPVTECVDITVNVAGIEMPITVYITGIGVAYDLLLSKRWIEVIRLEEKVYKCYFMIKGLNGEKLLVLPTPEEDLKEVEAEAK